MKALEEEEERKIHSLGSEYEHKLHAEKQTNKNLKGEVGAITQNVSYKWSFPRHLSYIYMRMQC